MAWITLIKLLLETASMIATHLSNKRLLEAGQAEAIAANLRKTLDDIKLADEIRRRAAADFERDGGVRNDPHRRD